MSGEVGNHALDVEFPGATKLQGSDGGEFVLSDVELKELLHLVHANKRLKED